MRNHFVLSFTEADSDSVAARADVISATSKAALDAAIVTQWGTDQGDKLIGTGSADHVFGREGGDTIDGGAGNDVMYGDAGADTLIGGNGADKLVGGYGDDVIRDVWVADASGNLVADDAALIDAGVGHDTIFASGADTIMTGIGLDVIVIGAAGETALALSADVTVTDFMAGRDVLQFDLSNGGVADALTLSLRLEDGNTIIVVTDGEGASHDAVTLLDVTGATLDQLVADYTFGTAADLI